LGLFIIGFIAGNLVHENVTQKRVRFHFSSTNQSSLSFPNRPLRTEAKEEIAKAAIVFSMRNKIAEYEK
jgi:hypothetical protein